MKSVTYEELKAQEAEFRSRHPDWQHTPVLRYREQVDRINEVWGKLLQRQNGRDVDDAVVNGEHRAVRYLQEHVAVDGGKHVLAVGVGTGREVLAIREAGYCCMGVTLGPMNVAFAREMLGLSLEAIDAHAMIFGRKGMFSEFQDRSYDAIIALQTLEHSWAPLMLLIEFCRLLKPGGKVIVETPAAATWTMGRDLHHTLCPTPRQLIALMWKAGFPRVQCPSHGCTAAMIAPDAEIDKKRFEGYTFLDDATEDVLCVGERWTDADAENVEPTIRELTR